MTWYHVLLGLSVAALAFAVLQLTGTDRVAWSNPTRRLAYVALAIFGFALALGIAFADDSRITSAMLVGWAVGIGAGAVRSASSSRSGRSAR